MTLPTKSHETWVKEEVQIKIPAEKRKKYKRVKRNEKRATPRTARETSKSIATKDTLSERKARRPLIIRQ